MELPSIFPLNFIDLSLGGPDLPLGLALWRLSICGIQILSFYLPDNNFQALVILVLSLIIGRSVRGVEVEPQLFVELEF